MLRTPRLWFGASLHLLVLLLLAGVVTFHVPLTQPLTNPFEEAEYAVFGFLAQTRADFRMPVLIHGGLDVLPSRMAAVTCLADAQIVCVRTVNTLLQFAAISLFLAVLAMVARLGTAPALLASVPATAMLWFCNAPTMRVVDAHQGTPGIRDLFVLAALLLMAWICRRLDKGSARDAPAALLALGGLAGLGVFWAYNRGLVLVLVLGTFTVGLCALRRSFRPALLTTVGGVIGLAAVLAASGTVTVTETMSNILYWSRNESIWHMPFELRLLLPTAGFALLLGATWAWAAWVSLRAKRFGQLLLLSALGLTFGLYGVQSLNRPDAYHIRWILWPAVLILAVVIWDRAEQAVNLAVRPWIAMLAAIVMLSGVGIEFYDDGSVARLVVSGLKDNVGALTRKMPRDRDLADADLARVADIVAASGRCTFAANNVAIVHLLSRTVPCSRFAFGIYVAADQQQEVIADLERTQPAIILWDSMSWWSNIDGRDFQARLPVLADWIEAQYPIRTAVGQYILLSRAFLGSVRP